MGLDGGLHFFILYSAGAFPGWGLPAHLFYLTKAVEAIVFLILSATFYSVVHGFHFSLDMFAFGLILGMLYIIKGNSRYPIIVRYINNIFAVGFVLYSLL